MNAPKEHPLAIFRVDASPNIGGGHVMRCLSIARVLERGGWRVTFASRSTLVRDLALLAGMSPEVITLQGPAEAAALEAQFPAGCTLLIVDHYGLDFEFEQACRTWADHILVVSDQPGQRHDCDFLLDPTLGRAAAEYVPYVPADCGVLTGPRYAPLRPEFVAPYSRSPSRGVDRVLVAMGATDPDNITSRVLDELVGLDLEIDVVLTSRAPHLNDVRSKKVGKLHADVDAAQLARLMQAADLAIGAGGLSAWERCASALPSLLIVIADNQTEVAKCLELAGAAQVLGRSQGIADGAIAGAIRALNKNELDDMAVSAHRTCDGRGAQRIATLVTKHVTETGHTMRLRPVAPADCHVVYQWQVHPDVRRYAHRPIPPNGREHESWFAERLADPEEQYFIVELEDSPSGVLRLERYAQFDGDWLISILIAPDCQRQGLGRATLDLAHSLWPDSIFVAEVLPENAASHHLFASAGYTRDGGRYLRGGAAGAL